MPVGAIPITAWALVNSLGTSTEQVARALRSGAPGFSAPPEGTPFSVPCGAVREALPALPDALREIDSHNNRMVNHALQQIEPELSAALARWGPQRVGICVGSSTAAMDEIEASHARHFGDPNPGIAADVFDRGSAEGLVLALRALTGCAGPVSVLSNACASSGKAFASAKRWLAADLVDAVLVGGADTLCQMTLRGFRALGLLSPEPTRPFCVERRGINIGEGAAFALLEREGRGPLLLGAGESADAHHMTRPDPEGRGAQAAMQMALDDAGIRSADIDLINAHGTGTRVNDAMEAHAIAHTLGSGARPHVVSTKGYVGHTLGAAGATEAVFCLIALGEGWIPASAGALPVDPELPIEIPTAPLDTPLRYAMSNSFAFGGSNVSLVFGAPA